MTIDDLIHILKNESQAVFQVALDRYLQQPGKTINDANCLGGTLLISAASNQRALNAPVVEVQNDIITACWSKKTQA